MNLKANKDERGKNIEDELDLTNLQTDKPRELVAHEI